MNSVEVDAKGVVVVVSYVFVYVLYTSCMTKVGFSIVLYSHSVFGGFFLPFLWPFLLLVMALP